MIWNRPAAPELRTQSSLSCDFLVSIRYLARIARVFHCAIIMVFKSSPTVNTDTTNKHLAHELKARHKDTEQAGDAEVADAGPDVQPAAFVPDHEEEVERQDIADSHDDHEKGAGGHSESPVENPQVCTNEGEGYHQFEHKEGALRERTEHWDETVNAVE